MCKLDGTAVLDKNSESYLIIEALDELNNVTGKLKLIQLSISYILEESIGSDESFGFTNIMFDIIRQIEYTEGTLQKVVKGGAYEEE